MPSISRVHFLIHGFCYAEMAAAGGLPDPLAPYLARETRCAVAWRTAVHAMAPADLLVVIPWPGTSRGPTRDFASLALAALGDRCLVLEAADGSASTAAAVGAGVDPAVAAAFAPTTRGDASRLNREELDTGRHGLALATQFLEMLRERRYDIDPRAVTSVAWGASFDGCVTKYSLYLRRLLGWRHPVAVAFDMTVPDARFAVDATQIEVLAVGECVRAFMLQAGAQYLALFVANGNSLADPAGQVAVPLDPRSTTVLSKQGLRLWPDPEPYLLRDVPAGYEEAPQQVVGVQVDRLIVPLSAGLVYRLARAPAYLVAGPDLSLGQFRARLLAATLVPVAPPPQASAG